jgi:biotin/methionine sulfoxide reductase
VCLAGAHVTDEIRHGVVQLSTGAWFDPLNASEIGSTDKHGNPNVLTMDKGTSRLAQPPSAQTAFVQVALYTGDVPELTAFVPPQIDV